MPGPRFLIVEVATIVVELANAGNAQGVMHGMMELEAVRLQHYLERVRQITSVRSQNKEATTLELPREEGAFGLFRP